MKSHDQEHRLPRRRVLQWFAAVAAAEGVSLPAALGQEAKPAATGYGQDPVMACPAGSAPQVALSRAAPGKAVPEVSRLNAADDAGSPHWVSEGAYATAGTGGASVVTVT